MKNLLMLLSLFTICFISCKKDPINTPPSPNDLIVGTWTATAFGVDANNDDMLQESEKQPIPTGSSLVETFNSNGSGVVTTTVAGGSPNSVTIKWSIINNGGTLRVINGTDTTDATLITLTSKELSGYDSKVSPHYIFVFNK